MHPNVDRVVAAARAAGVDIRPERFAEGTRTAADAARSVGCEVGQIVKSLVFVAGDEPLLALVSGANRADLARIGRELGADTVRRADAAEARAATGFSIGGVPPFGHDRVLRVLVDRDLTRYPVVWAAAGLPDATFPISSADLVRVSGGRVVELAEAATMAG
jgi:prolyl-tRNA editing enzyme YbaK/EbsC (Cys-tRNA(Pro) deacylase)